MIYILLITICVALAYLLYCGWFFWQMAKDDEPEAAAEGQEAGDGK